MKQPEHDAISRSALIEIYSRNNITNIVTVGDKSVMQHLLDAPALFPPLQKPLPFHEFLDLIGPGHEVVTFCEGKGADHTDASIWISGQVIDAIGIESIDHIAFEAYGKTWRAWAARPTDEERAAAPWEE